MRVLLGRAPDKGTIQPGLIVGYVPRASSRSRHPLTVARFVESAPPGPGNQRALADVGAGKLGDRQLGAVGRRGNGLARALVGSPGVLVLDEPVRGIDYAGEAELYTLIGRLRSERGFGVLLVSHDLHVVMAQSDRVICLNRHVCCSGVPQSVAQHPEYARLFGAQAARAFALYHHHHDHRHDLAGEPQSPAVEVARRARGYVSEPFLMRAPARWGLGLAVIAAPLGCFVVWRRMAYYGEAIAQAGLIGIAAGLALSLNLTASVLVVTLAVSVLLVVLSRQQLVPFDSLLGLLAHAALAIGVILASLVRGPQLDLMAFLFGDIFAISATDLKWIYLGGALALAALVYVWRPLLSLCVHEDLAAAEGTQVERVKLIFVLVLALVVAIAIKIVGVLLTIAFLIMPAAAARPLSETPEQMALFAAIFGSLSVALGLFLSVSLDTPGGPSIVLMLALFFIAAIFPTILRGRRSRRADSLSPSFTGRGLG